MPLLTYKDHRSCCKYLRKAIEILFPIVSGADGRMLFEVIAEVGRFQKT